MSDEERIHPPRPEDISKARAEGRFARSPDLVGVAVLATFALYLFFRGEAGLERAVSFLRDWLSSPDVWTSSELPGGSGAALARVSLGAVLAAVTPCLLLLGGAALLGTAWQAGLRVVPGLLAPDARRFSPAQLAWSPRTVLGRSLTALACTLGLLLAMSQSLDTCWPPFLARETPERLARCLFWALGWMIPVAALDYALARRRFLDGLRRTRTEEERRQREQEMAPETRARIRERMSSSHLESAGEQRAFIVGAAGLVLEIARSEGEVPRVHRIGGVELLALGARRSLRVKRDASLARFLAEQGAGHSVPRSHWSCLYDLFRPDKESS